MKKITNQKGFTLIEILVVIGIIAILAAVVLIAINPARQFAQGRNSQRTSNVNAVINAIGQNLADNKGLIKCGTAVPVAIENVITATFDPSPTNPILPGSGQIIALAAGGANLRPCIVPNYMSEISTDPQPPGVKWDGTNYNTGYRIFRSPANANRVTVFAPNTELCTATPCTGADLIEITR